MAPEDDDLGDPIYREERPVTTERLKFISTGVLIIFFLVMVVYVGSLHSGYMVVFAFLLFGFFLYPAFQALILGFRGIHELTVYTSGFVPPYCTNLRLCRPTDGFIKWKEVAGIYSNKNLRISKLFPFLVVRLRDATFTIPDHQIVNINIFLSTVRPFTKIITETEFRPGLFPVTYYPPSNEARLDDDAIILRYGGREERLAFEDIRHVRVNVSYQLLLNDGKRIGLLGMSREDVVRIKNTLGNFKSTSHSGISPPISDGLLSGGSDSERESGSSELVREE